MKENSKIFVALLATDKSVKQKHNPQALAKNQPTETQIKTNS
jgi:hypothetical protein